MATNIKCPFCKGTKVWKKGKVPAIGGPKTRYVCYSCGKSFYAARAGKTKSGKKKAG